MAEIKVICLYGKALFSLLPQYKGFQKPPIFSLLPANTNASKSPFRKKGKVPAVLTLKVKLQVTINARGCVRVASQPHSTGLRLIRFKKTAVIFLLFKISVTIFL